MAIRNVCDAARRGTSISILEKDAKGRVLFEVEFDPTYFYSYDQRTIFSYMIMQKSDDSNVFYYADCCFVICENREGFSEAMREELKTKNDWDEPLDEDRMTQRRLMPDFVPTENMLPCDSEEEREHNHFLKKRR